MNLSKKIWKRSGFLVQPIAKWYFKKPRIWRYKGLKLAINPEVFFPHLTASTAVFIDYLDTLELKEKSLLDIGCGSGALSVFSAKKGANVTAIDISEKATENTLLNAQSHQVDVDIKVSNLFDMLEPNGRFDFTVINPPFYPKTPKSAKEMAWYCGEDFEYFHKLFGQVNSRWSTDQIFLMILSEDCQLSRIEEIAKSNNLLLQHAFEQKSRIERHTIYRINQNKL